MYVTESNLLPDNYRGLLLSGQPLQVSGQPLNHWQKDGKDFFFHGCSAAVDMDFVPRLAIEKNIDAQQP